MTTDPLARFFQKVKQEGDCWAWVGARNPHGYGRMGWQGSTVAPQRWLYERLVAPIPAGLELDHLCRVRHCVNVLEHLDPVTPAVNIARAKAYSWSLMACKRGHEYTEINTWINGAGCRVCRTCRRDLQRARTVAVADLDRYIDSRVIRPGRVA